MNEFNGMSYDKLAEHVLDAIAALRQRSYHEGYKQGKFDASIEGAIKESRKYNAQEDRDEIIEKAKRDVTARPDFKFIVNREKRTVVALNFGYVISRGIAKCDPSDCFNVHIGKAIALRRALGLDVPAEYLNAPQPTEVRVGDVVQANTDPYDRTPYKVEDIFENRAYGCGWVPLNCVTIIDDSREEVTE